MGEIDDDNFREFKERDIVTGRLRTWNVLNHNKLSTFDLDTIFLDLPPPDE